jgi:hypothetical protein
MRTTARQAARQNGLRHYNTGVPCRNGHNTYRLVSTGHCSECLSNYQKTYIANNKEQVQKRNAEYHQEYRKDKKDLLLEQSKAWHKNNRARSNALSKKRKTGKLKRTPPWLSEHQLFLMECRYSIAKMLSKYGCEPWEVDHIVPLQGNKVCGLHVPWNLQVIPASENRKKGNKYVG